MHWGNPLFDIQPLVKRRIITYAEFHVKCWSQWGQGYASFIDRNLLNVEIFLLTSPDATGFRYDFINNSHRVCGTCKVIFYPPIVDILQHLEHSLLICWMQDSCICDLPLESFEVLLNKDVLFPCNRKSVHWPKHKNKSSTNIETKFCINVQGTSFSHK